MALMSGSSSGDAVMSQVVVVEMAARGGCEEATGDDPEAD
jgi:hypothetical protein